MQSVSANDAESDTGNEMDQVKTPTMIQEALVKGSFCLFPEEAKCLLSDRCISPTLANMTSRTRVAIMTSQSLTATFELFLKQSGRVPNIFAIVLLNHRHNA